MLCKRKSDHNTSKLEKYTVHEQNADNKNSHLKRKLFASF